LHGTVVRLDILLNIAGKRPRGRPRTRRRDNITDLVWPVLVRIHQNYLRCWNPWDTSILPRAAVNATLLLRGKAGMKW